MKRFKYTVLLLFAASTAVNAAEAKSAPLFSNDGLIYLLVGVAIFLLIVVMALAKSVEGVASLLKSKNKKAVSILLLLGMAGNVNAVGGSLADSWSFWMLLFANSILLIAVFALLRNVNSLVRSLNPEKDKEEAEVSFGFLTDAVPVEREGEIIMDHEYDGIRELDNNLPPWWKYMFYVTIVFALIYLPYYHMGPGLLQEAELDANMAEADVQIAEYRKANPVEVNLETITSLTDASSLASGEKVFVQNCVACHGVELGGGAGPNLTDKFWKHGGSVKNIFTSIKRGIPEKGMIAWEGTLNDVQIHELSSYILSKQGTNPVGAKEAEGEEWME